MNDELTPEQKFAAEDVETLVPRALLLGKKPEEVVADLVQLDWSAAAARALVARVTDQMRQFNESPESRRRLIDAAFKQFVGGLIAGLAAAILTAFVLIVAMGGGGVFVIGALLLLGGSMTAAGRGWSRWRMYRRWALHLDEKEKAAGFGQASNGRAKS
jgi:hypothetical protein